MASTCLRSAGSGLWEGRPTLGLPFGTKCAHDWSLAHGWPAPGERGLLGADFSGRAILGHPTWVATRRPEICLLEPCFRVGMLPRPERPQGTGHRFTESDLGRLIAAAVEALQSD